MARLALTTSLARSARNTVARHRGFSSAPASSVPVIDMASYSKASAAAAEPPPSALVNEVALACEQWGFFQVVNHGLDAGLRSRAEDQQRAFFALPRHAKEALRRTAGNSRGW
jgi:isopenicillin N synthase-like dioxygenase